MSGHVAIIGSGRSGSSLLGQLFERHMPYRFEPDIRGLLDDPPDRRECWKFPKVPGRQPDPGLGVAVDDLRAAGCGTVVWLVRHPLDCVCSLAVLWDEGVPEVSDGTRWLQDNLPARWRAAVGWVNTNHRGRANIDGLVAADVRYENIVVAPAATGRKLLDTVDVTVDPGELDGWAQTVGNDKRRDDEDDRQADLWYRDDHTVRVGRWRENMPAAEADALWTFLEPVASRWGYTLDQMGEL